MDKIGKYDIVRELGRGGMGVVYEGVDPLIGRRVAIKTIRLDVLTAAAEQQEAQQRFMREARSAGNLSHPSIVTIYEVGEHDGLTFIAMEFIEGQSLEAIIATGERLPAGRIVDLMGQLGDALDYAHRNGVIHRDIKPANILIDKEGRPRIVDFGIARVASSSLTQTHTVLGTPSYMAPEQIAGQKVDHRADLFALGAILYELLTMRRAFGGDNVTTVIYQIMHVTPPPPRTIDGELPDGFDAIVDKALAKDPNRRYQSGRELAEDLRHPEQAAAWAPVPAAAPVDATVAMRVPAVAQPAAGVVTVPPGDSSPGRRKTLLALVGGMMAVVAVAAGAMLFLASRDQKMAPDLSGGAAALSTPSQASEPAPAAQPGPPPPVVPDAAGAQGATPASAAPATPSAPAAVPPGGAAKPAAPASSAAARGVSPTTAKPAAPPAKSSAVAVGARLMGGGKPTGAEAARDKAEPAPPPKPPAKVYEMMDVDERPQVVTSVKPVYPEDAARLKLEDTVVVKALVNAEGRVDDAQLLRFSTKDAAFNAAALKAVRQYTFKPARKKGQAVACWFNLAVPFTLKLP